MDGPEEGTSPKKVQLVVPSKKDAAKKTHKRNRRNGRRNSATTVFSVYAPSDAPFKSAFPARRRSTLTPKMTDNTIRNLATLETFAEDASSAEDARGSGRKEEVAPDNDDDEMYGPTIGIDTSNPELYSLDLNVQPPYFHNHIVGENYLPRFGKAKLANDLLLEKEKTLVHMHAFGHAYFYQGKECAALTGLLEMKLATVALKPMRFFLKGATVALLLYVIYDVSVFSGINLYLILATKLCFMIPGTLAVLKFTYNEKYWDHNFRQKFIWWSSLFIGLTICFYSYFSQGASYGVFGLYMGLIVLLAPIYFGQCCLLTFILWLAYLYPLFLADRLQRFKKLYEQAFSLGVILCLYLFYRYKYLQFLREDILVSFIMWRQLETTKQNKEVSQLLLHSMLPEKIIYRLNNGERHFADPYDMVTVLFCEVCNFNKMTVDLTETRGHEDGPRALVQVINAIYTTFDDLVDDHHVHKVETVGEVYMVVSGAPRKTYNHANLAANMAVSMIKSIPVIRDDINEIFGSGVSDNIDVHIGLNSGPIVAGVCGEKSPRYKLFGDTVNTASRMESTCPAGMIQASTSTAELLDGEVFLMTQRDPIEVKGKGTMRPFFINGIAGGSSSASFVPTYIQEDEFDRMTVAELKNATASALASTLISIGNDQKMGTAGFSKDRVLRTGLAFGWRAIWGLPHAPSCVRFFCNCRSMAFATSPPPSETVLRRHSVLEQEFYDTNRAQFVFSFRVVMTVLMMSMLGLYFVQDMSRPEEIKDYCAGEFETREHCKKAFGAEEGTPLCNWDNSKDKCGRNLNMTNHPCGWVITDTATDTAKVQLELFILLRFAIYLPVQLLSLVLSFLPCATSRLKDQKPFVQGLTFFYYMFASGIIIFVSVLGGNPGHFTVMAMTVLLVNLSYLKLYLRLIWSCLVVFQYFFMVYYIDLGFRRELFCFNPLVETIRPMQYIIFGLVTVLPQIVVRETYLRSALFLKSEMDSSNAKLNEENERSTKMLLKLLPEKVVKELKSNSRSIIADYFDSVTIVFTDMKGFTAYSSTVTPKQLVNFLNLMYNKFDRITDMTGLYKVEIIGDAYYCVGGCPEKVEDHAEQSAKSALLMLDAIEDMKRVDENLEKANVQIRVGVHTGPVVAAVVGVKDPRYHLFGDSVNFAMKMESHGVPNRVHCSASTYEQVVKRVSTFRKAPFTFERRGVIDVKGLGSHETYFITK